MLAPFARNKRPACVFSSVSARLASPRVSSRLKMGAKVEENLDRRTRTDRARRPRALPRPAARVADIVTDVIVVARVVIERPGRRRATMSDARPSWAGKRVARANGQGSAASASGA